MHRLILIIFSLCSTGCSFITSKVNVDALGDWNLECPAGNYLFENGYFKPTIAYNERYTRRCEISNRTLLQLNIPFSFSFSISTSSVEYTDRQWHSIFQIHSFPDLALGEIWRCPVLAFEIQKGHIRMFNRWDINMLSKTAEGTCASDKNSISSRLLFDNYRIEKNSTYHLVVSGIMSYEENGVLDVYINGEKIAHVTGPNTFNDVEGPYLKLGIYKPTSWDVKKGLSYSYRNISFNGDLIED